MNHYHFIEKAIQVIPPLDGSLHKGQAGRIGVVGGSKDYTGAPYFSGYGALKLGVDLTHIICDPQASLAIKTYSPDIMVHSYLSSPKEDKELYESNLNEFQKLLDRLHVVVVGPGLGRDEVNQDWAEWTIHSCVEKNIPLVLDADVLWLLHSKPEILNGYNKVILTPNIVEFERLLNVYSITKDNNSNNNNDNKNNQVEVEEQGRLALELSKKLNSCVILLKSSTDIIAQEGHETIKEKERISVKRCGGQGDILSGLVAAWLAWTKLYTEREQKKEAKGEKSQMNLEEEGMLISAALGSYMMRLAAQITFSRLGRSMQSSDILNFISMTFDGIFNSGDFSQFIKGIDQYSASMANPLVLHNFGGHPYQ